MLTPDTLIAGRYHIVRKIGQGGMGAVYEAVDERLGGKVALKQTLVTADYLKKAFEREARLLANLRHPNLPRVIDHFIDADGQFLVMDYVVGKDLAEILQERGKPFPLELALHWADQLLDVLNYLHSHNPPIIHRDIKPQNAKVTTGNRVMLLDFGLAKGSPLQTQVASDGSIPAYTPSYASLEQIRGSGTDERSDLYSLGATLYNLLTNQIPVDALTRSGALIDQEPDPQPPIHIINRQVPPTISALVIHAVAIRAKDRPTSAVAMRQQLRTAVTQGATTGRTLAQPSAPPPPPAQPAPPPPPAQPAPSAQTMPAPPLAQTMPAASTPAPEPPEAVPPLASATPVAPPPPAPHKRSLLPWAIGTVLVIIPLLILGALATGTRPIVWIIIGAVVVLPLLLLIGILMARGRAIQRPHVAITRDNAAQVTELVRLRGHTTWVRSVTFARDGQLLASVPKDSTVRLWNMTNGALVRTLAGHTNWVWSVAFSPDGTLLASASEDKTVRLWKLASGSLPRPLTGHDAPVTRVVFAPDGRLLASASKDRTVRLWKVADGALLRTLTGHDAAVQSVVFSPDGRLLASASQDRTVRLWKAADGALLRTLEDHTNDVLSVAFSPNGRLLASGSNDATVRLWNMADGTLLRILGVRTSTVNCVAFSPDGTLLASGSGDDTVRLWNVADGTLLCKLETPADVLSVAFSPDGKLLASGSWDETLRLWGVAP